MSGNWTAGPWEVDHEEGWIIRAERSPEGLRFLVADLNWFDGGDEEKATAHLIAAAPELAESLAECLKEIRAHHFGPDGIKDEFTARAFDRGQLVLAKARGEA